MTNQCQRTLSAVIARSSSDEAIHASARRGMDCFACARNDGVNAETPYGRPALGKGLFGISANGSGNGHVYGLCLESLGKPEFTLDEVYAFERHLGELYPGNQNVKPKIRQQLQYLRDRGFIEFVSRGSYRVRS